MVERAILPVRIQLSRRSGFKLQAVSLALNGLPAVSVARPGRWGNPYSVAVYGLDLALKLFRDTLDGYWNPGNVAHLNDAIARATYDLHNSFRARLGYHLTEAARGELRGRNLACWCRPDSRCHADILLEIANS